MKPLNSVFAFVLLALTCAAQQPEIVNAKLETRNASAGLQPVIAGILSTQNQPAWFGYAVQGTPNPRTMCCFESAADAKADRCCGSCRLEGGNNFTSNSGDGDCTGKLENSDFYVLARVMDGHVQRIRAYSPGCKLDAGGLPVFWINSVTSAQSVAWLKTVVTDTASPRKMDQEALYAIVIHAGPEAERALTDFVKPGQPEKLREHAAFWLGVESGRSGFLILQKLARDDDDARFREKLTFVISQSKEPEAIQEIIRMAHSDPAPKVRSQAIFWLAQSAGKQAVAAISDAMEHDPDFDVKKHAVFAMSQLPKDEGVSMLLKIARTNKNFRIRKEAIFWLGQTNDPRALDYLESVVLGKAN